MATITFQAKTIDSGTAAVTFSGAPGPITLDGTFNGGTITETLPGSSVAINTFTVDNHFFFNGQDVTFTMAGAGGSESVIIRWHRANKPY